MFGLSESGLSEVLSEVLSEPCRMACRTSLSEWLVGAWFFHGFGLVLGHSLSALGWMARSGRFESHCGLQVVWPYQPGLRVRTPQPLL